ncbi:hypothetical protein EDF56_11658 [Novosphingobium sp. PhB165]|nr:hypothetical protein EDF56_11658 [Novosphingobium sp. PhB165]
MLAHIVNRLLSTLGVSVYSNGNQAPHFLIGEDEVVRFLNGNSESLASTLYQFDEVTVLKLHAHLQA